MPTILDEIIAFKKIEVAALKKRAPLTILQAQSFRVDSRNKGFLNALKNKRGFSVISEIKKKSPSKGLISKDFDPVRIAKQYEAAGARALSVLTDKKFFGGSAEILKAVRKAASLPILRKDFIVDEYQVLESKLMGADAILLIAAVLSFSELKRLALLAKQLRLDVLFEVHSKKEIQKILPLKPSLVGINNRDLRTFQVDIKLTEKLIRFLPKKTLIVSESGIRSNGDLAHLKDLGVGAFLVGETLMREKNPGQALKNLLGNSRG